MRSARRPGDLPSIAVVGYCGRYVDGASCRRKDYQFFGQAVARFAGWLCGVQWARAQPDFETDFIVFIIISESHVDETSKTKSFS